jgi:hypothetical protein
MEFEDCDNIKLPVDSQVLIDELINFRDTLSGDTVENQVETLGQIIDSISDNPDWSITAPANLNVKVSIDKSVIKKIPLAVAASVLTPKNLLPLYTLLAVVQSGATFTYNQAVTEINTTTNQITSFGNQGADIGTQGSNIINRGEDFLKKYKRFVIEVVSQINAEFLRVLYEILKKDIVNLISTIIKDVAVSKLEKKYTIIRRLTRLALLGQLLIIFSDFRKCKSLLDNILLLINLVDQGLNTNTPLKSEIPSPLLLLSSVLPGYSPERATINSIQILQSLGIPTGTLPDGSSNLMLLYTLATNKAVDQEESENGKVEVVGAYGPSFGKKI